MIDIVIVNWNSGTLICRCIESILKSEPGHLVNKIYVVDNASTDNSIDLIPKNEKVSVIQNQDNKGFAVACNQGFLKCESKYILLLNPDARLMPDTLEKSVQWIQIHDEVSVLGVQLLKPDNTISLSCARFPTPLTIFFDAAGLSYVFPKIFTPADLMSDWDHQESRFVDQVSGAYMFFLRALFKTVGYMDERFFVYCEDLDFSKRVAQVGGRIFFNADIKAIHEENGTTNKVKAFRLSLLLNSRLLYAKKHFTTLGFLSVCVSTFFIEFFTRSIMNLLKFNLVGVREVWKAYNMLLKRLTLWKRHYHF